MVALDLAETAAQFGPAVSVQICDRIAGLAAIPVQPTLPVCLLTQMVTLPAQTREAVRAHAFLHHIHIGEPDGLDDVIVVPMPFRNDDIMQALRSLGLELPSAPA